MDEARRRFRSPSARPGIDDRPSGHVDPQVSRKVLPAQRVGVLALAILARLGLVWGDRRVM